MLTDQRARRAAGLLYDVYKTGDESYLYCRKILPELNACTDMAKQREILEDLLGDYPKSAGIVTPFLCDLGHHIYLGEQTFINMDCLFLDEGRIYLGDRVLVGPRCAFYTPLHPMDPCARASGLEKALPIVVEDDVWICGGCTINPGVRIGKGSVIGSGSVVTRNIPAGVFAAGNPCRIVRYLSEGEKRASVEEVFEYEKAMESGAGGSIAP